MENQMNWYKVVVSQRLLSPEDKFPLGEFNALTGKLTIHPDTKNDPIWNELTSLTNSNYTGDTLEFFPGTTFQEVKKAVDTIFRDQNTLNRFMQNQAQEMASGFDSLIGAKETDTPGWGSSVSNLNRAINKKMPTQKVPAIPKKQTNAP